MNTSKAKKSWLVWNKNGRIPSCKHPTYDDALDEAKRLARLHNVDGVYILEAVKYVAKAETPVEVLEVEPFTEDEIKALREDEIPF